MLKVILIGLTALMFVGCAKHEVKLDCDACTAHLVNDGSVIDCTSCKLNVEGQNSEGNLINLPKLPSPPEK